jgi:hypothetical protein
MVVGLSGFEPLTSPLSGVRSNQLSYRPMRRKFTGIPGYVKKRWLPVVRLRGEALERSTSDVATLSR